MSPVSAEPPHLVQLEIRRTFLTGNCPTTHRPSRTALAGDDRGVDHAADHAQERHEEAPPPPPPPANIYLGETYTANVYLSVPANAAPHAAHKVHLAVEMHSGIPPLATTRTAGTPPPPPPPPPQIRQYPLSKHDFERIEPSPPGTGEEVVVVPLEWELKELASHAVVCLVSYGVQLADRETGHLELVTRSYRKILRFEVLNPLSVRTKAHAPSSSPSFPPNTFYSPLARRKLFLEVQVQNHCDSRMTFRRMRFEPVQGFHVSDQANEGFVVDDVVVDPDPEDESAAAPHQRAGLDFLPLATGSVRQFLYILTRSSSTRLSGDPAAAAAQQQQQQEPLGRLDIVWQTETGQHGRLQSATLGRKLPPPPPPRPSGPTSLPDLRLGATSKYATSSPILSRSGFGGGGGGTAPSDFGLTLDGDGVEEPAGDGVKGLIFDVTIEAILPSPRSDTTITTTTTAGAFASRATFLVNEPVSVRLRIRVARDRNNDRALTTTTTPGAITSADINGAAETTTTTTPPPGGKAMAPPRQQRRRVRVAIQHVQWHPSPIRDQPPLVPHSSDDDNNDGDEVGDDDAGRSTVGVGYSRERISSHSAIPGALPPSNVRTQRLSLPGVTSLQLQQSLLVATRNDNGAAVAAESASSPIVGGITFVAGHQAAPAADDDDRRSNPMMHGVRLPLPIPIRPPPPAIGPVPSAGVIRLGPDTLDVGYLDVPLDGFDDNGDEEEGGSEAGGKVVEMRFVPLERGVIRFGGVRVLVLSPSSSSSPAEVEQEAPVSDAETVWEASSIAEIWCQ